MHFAFAAASPLPSFRRTKNLHQNFGLPVTFTSASTIRRPRPCYNNHNTKIQCTNIQQQQSSSSSSSSDRPRFLRDIQEPRRSFFDDDSDNNITSNNTTQSLSPNDRLLNQVRSTMSALGIDENSSSPLPPPPRKIATIQDLYATNPMYALLGAGGAALMSILAWYLLQTTIEFALTYPMDDRVYIVRRITVVVRTALVSIFALASGTSGVTGLGLFLVATRVTYANITAPEALDIDFVQRFRSGSFGAVFLGQYQNGNDGTDVDVVVKCPVDSDLGRKLYDVERHTNLKLRSRNFTTSRFPNLLGELIIPADIPVSTGLARLGLVWQRSGSGDTLEQHMSTGSIAKLATMLGTSSSATPLRRQLSATLLRELGLIVQDLQSCGIVHRDIKPENLLIVPNEYGESSLQVIDFGSSCDWNSILKKGLRLATCDPIYTAPERRLDIFAPALRFDVYSIGLIALRAAMPSITDSTAFDKFVTNVMSRGRSSIERVCSAVESGRIKTSTDVRADLLALAGPGNEDMYAIFATMLTETPAERADVSDCLRSRFVEFGGL